VIFVSVGTNEARFDRLLRAVAELPHDEELLIQHGHSAPPAREGARLVDFLSFDEMTAAIASARVVITHAGVGSVLVSLANGKRPVVVPRLRAHAEAVDDHQLQLGRRFAAAGLVTLVEDLRLLAGAVVAADPVAPPPPTGNSLVTELGEFLQLTLATTPAAR
jgi:UDP-N-acetylglucosamine transferase subunit ALG13